MTAVATRRAEAYDLEVLGVIGPAAYAAAFAADWDDPSALTAHLMSFSMVAFGTMLRRSDMRVWVAEQGGALVGFQVLHLAEAPAEGSGEGAELSHLYLLGSARRAGIGRRFIDLAGREAQVARARRLWLRAPSTAKAALSAFERWGFAQEPGGVQCAETQGQASAVILVKHLQVEEPRLALSGQDVRARLRVVGAPHPHPPT